MAFTIAIIGRPNVGKSTLFNKLAGRKLAIVNNFPGVTRDRKEAEGGIGDIEFNLIDTAGYEDEILKDSLEEQMVAQTEIAIYDADLCIFMVDGREGIISTDKVFASLLRKKNTPVLLVMNKCEGGVDGYEAEYYKLGFGEPIAISSEHKLGWADLYRGILPHYEDYNANKRELEISEQSEDEDAPLQIAIIGRPNAGKSTLVNRLLNEERVIVNERAGTTRDAISLEWEYEGRKIKLVDTAGIRKKHNIHEDLEKLSVDDTFKAIRFAHIIILMLDANCAMDKQDLSIASMIIKEGRGLVLALNKWDTIEEKHSLIKEVIYSSEKNMPGMKGMPIIPISAKNGIHIDKLMSACFDVYKHWNTYITTSKLNNWLTYIQEEHTPPLFKGRTVKLKYITQAKKRPPTFVIFTNSPERLEKTSYDRFLLNKIREDFDMKGTVVRIILKKSENPYEGRKERKNLKEKLGVEKSKKKGLKK